MNRPRPALPLLVAAALSAAACDDAASPAALAGGAGLDRAASAVPSHCPNDLHQRTPEQVLEDHRAALAAGDLDAVACNYASDAVVISDGGIDVGHDEIRASLEFFLVFFGGVQPVVTQQITTEMPRNKDHMVRLLFTFDAPCVSIPDGVDTYIIRDGQIQAQTSHAVPVFSCPP